MSRRYDGGRPLLDREEGNEVEVHDTVIEGSVRGMPAFQVRNIAIVRYRMSTRARTVTLTSPWMAGIPEWFFQPLPIAFDEGEVPCPTCQAGADWPEPYCPTCKGSLKLRECAKEDCEQMAPTGDHAMEAHDVCGLHAPDCAGRCYP